MCGREYENTDGIPDMLSGDLLEFIEEIEIQDRVSDKYDEQRYKDEFSLKYHRWWARHMISQVALQEPILDNGCGVGFLLDLLECENKIGVDISSGMLKKAWPRHSRLILANSEKLPIEDESVGTIFCRGLLHHLPNPQRGVEEIRRVLRPGGNAVFVEPNNNVFVRIPRMITYKTNHFSSKHRSFSREELLDMMDGLLSIDQTGYFGYIAYPFFGFPDILPISRILPFRKFLYAGCMAVDAALSNIPVLQRLGWAIMVTATRI